MMPSSNDDNRNQGDEVMAQFTTTQVAEKFDTTPRTLRKFLRSDARARNAADSLPGKGSRYGIEGKDLAQLKKRFTAWVEAQAAKVEVEGDSDEG
jgi:hypothetical protein